MQPYTPNERLRRMEALALNVALGLGLMREVVVKLAKKLAVEEPGECEKWLAELSERLVRVNQAVEDVLLVDEDDETVALEAQASAKLSRGNGQRRH